MAHLLDRFRFARFEFILKSLDTIYMPVYKGSTLRGGFGHAFKKVVCVRRDGNCETCLIKGRCFYSYVFETPPLPDSIKMRKYPYAPHPFVITPPLEEKRTYLPNDLFRFELTLIGKAIDFLPYFIYTFDELGRMGIGKGRGKYRLEEVRDAHIGEGEGVIYTDKDKTLKNTFKLFNVDNLPTQKFYPSSFFLHLNFLTPTRLKFDGALTPKLEFHILIRNLLRRISLLSYFHCEEELSIDYKGVIDQAKSVTIQQEALRWVDWERYSNRQETRMKMGGFIGSIIFEGDVNPFAPFLLLGEQIHVGKGTSFGLGKYKILNF